MLGCLCCGGGAGDQAQGPVFKVLSCCAPVQWNRMRVLDPESAPKVVIFRLNLVDFVAGSSWSELLSHVVRNLLAFAPDSRLCGSGEARREVHPFFRHVL